MELLGHGFYYQDWDVGYTFQTLTRSVTETDIANFVGVSGMTEELFTSYEYLEKHTDFDGRLVPGALVFAIAEGLVIPATISRTGIAFLGCEMNIHGPTFVGDTLHVEGEVTGVAAQYEAFIRMGPIPQGESFSPAGIEGYRFVFSLGFHPFSPTSSQAATTQNAVAAR